MREDGIQTSVHYRPIHTFGLHSKHERVIATGLEKTDAIAPRLLTLPLYATLSDEAMDLVVSALAKAIQAN
jgi:dTDP-4-amino-4,6-dideoxygalactose transaminase